MLTVLAGIVLVASPMLMIGLFLRVANWRERRRNEGYARQIALTDAIHWELGAVVAPMVERRSRGVWMVRMAVPLDSPALVATLLGITERVFAAAAGSGKLQIVFTPGPSSSAARRPQLARPRIVESRAPLAAGAR